MGKNIRQFDAEIKEMYQSGYSSTLIAEHFNVSKIGVICRLRTLGIIKHKREKNRFNHGKNYKKYDKAMIDLYKQGLSLESIGKQLGLSRHTVYARLKLNDVELRNKKGIKHSLRNPTISLDFFEQKIANNTSDFDYFIGIFASDGNVYKNMVRISGIADENIEFLEHWCNFLDNKVKIHRRLRASKKDYYSEVCFKNQDIADLLSTKYGITPNKTFTIALPYINWHIVRGLFDGDGCLVKDKRSNSWKFEIVSASTTLAEQLYTFLVSEGLSAHLYENKNLYKISVIRKSNLKTIFQNLYKNCSYFLKRKYDKFLPIIQETE